LPVEIYDSYKSNNQPIDGIQINASNDQCTISLDINSNNYKKVTSQTYQIISYVLIDNTSIESEQSIDFKVNNTYIDSVVLTCNEANPELNMNETLQFTGQINGNGSN